MAWLSISVREVERQNKRSGKRTCGSALRRGPQRGWHRDGRVDLYPAIYSAAIVGQISHGWVVRSLIAWQKMLQETALPPWLGNRPDMHACMQGTKLNGPVGWVAGLLHGVVLPSRRGRVACGCTL